MPPRWKERQTMKKLLTNNVGTKILSLIIAAIIWFVIYDIEDPVTTNRYTLSVSIINEDKLEDFGKTYEILSGDTVTVSVSGKSSLLNQLRSTDLTAVADMTKLSLMNAVPIEVTAQKYQDQLEIDTGNATMNVDIEDIVTKDFKINFITEGTPEEGYIAGDITSSPNIITVTGSETSVNTLAQVAVTINIGGVSEDISTVEKVGLFDSAGNTLDPSRFTLSAEEVVTNVPLLKTKTVPVELDFTGAPADGFAVTGTGYGPKELEIAGTVDALKEISEIRLPDYDYTGIKESLQETVPVTDQLPSGIRITDGDPEKAIAVNIEVDEKDEREFEIELKNAEIRNSSPSLEYEINNGEDITITLTGGKTALSELKNSDIKVFLDVAGLTSGTGQVQLQIEELADNIKLKNRVNVSVKVTSKETEE